MRLIDADKLKTIYDNKFVELQKLKQFPENRTAEGRQLGVNYCINALTSLPTIPAIPMERIKQLREEIERSKPTNPDFKWYKGEIIQANKDLELIDNMIKEYSDGQ